MFNLRRCSLILSSVHVSNCGKQIFIVNLAVIFASNQSVPVHVRITSAHTFGLILQYYFLGAEPYPGISPYTIPNVLLDGYRIPKPVYLKDEL